MKCNYFLLLVQSNYVYFLYQWNLYLYQKVSRRVTEIIFWHYIKSNSPLLVLRQVALYTVLNAEEKWILPSSRREKSDSGLHIQEKRKVSWHFLLFLFPLSHIPTDSKAKIPQTCNFSLWKSVHPSWTSTMQSFVCSIFKFIMCTRVSTHSCSCM